MALTYYPDLSHLGLLVVPTTGMKCGDGLHLHRGGIMPELAHALGFRPSEDGFVIPLSRHGTFEKSLTAVSRAVAAVLPRQRFVAIEPDDIVVAQRHPANEVEAIEARANDVLDRNRIRDALAEARLARPPKPSEPGPEADAFRESLSLDPLDVVKRALAGLGTDPAIRIDGLPHTQDIGDRCILFVKRRDDSVVVGFGTSETDMRRSVSVQRLDTVNGGPAFVATGNQGQFVSPSAQAMVDELAYAFRTLDDELRGEALFSEPLIDEFERTLMEAHQRGEIDDDQFRELSLPETGEEPARLEVAERLVRLHGLADSNGPAFRR